MKLSLRMTSLAVLATVATAALSPLALADDSRQKNKNNWRNLGAAGAVVAGYGLLKHDRTATVLGAGTAGYGAYRYEKDRHSQDEGKRARARYHARQRYYRKSGSYIKHY